MRNLKIVLVAKPSSTDPLDYDISVHHNTMRSVYSSLVSLYKKGEITPQIAESWENSQNFTIWKLNISKNWNFENGDKITPRIVKSSLTRVLVIKNKKNSKSGLLEYLEGADKVDNINSNFKGLEIEDESLIFKFTKPMPDFLEKISFGLYGIVHPKDYLENGEWKDKKKINGSGLYRIKTWNNEFFEIERRDNVFNDKIDKNTIKVIRYIFPEDLSLIDDANMVFSDRLSNKLNEKDWLFESSTLNNKIIYIQVMSWKNRNSIFGNRESRQQLRTLFYRNLEKAGMTAVTNFFPPSIKGIQKNDLIPVTKDLKVSVVKTQPFSLSEYKKLGLKKSQADIFYEALTGLCKDLNASLVINEYPELIEDEEKVFDIQYLGTGISIDNPQEDVKFMFKSKHGIMLPDENSEINSHLNDSIDLNKIDKLLWDQAIIWPIRHYSTGFWYKKDLEVNLNELNTTLTPIDFQFLKWKE